MTYDELNKKSQEVAYLADQIGHKTGRKPDIWSVAATKLFTEYKGDITMKEIKYVTSTANDIIDRAEAIEAKVEKPVADH